MRIVFFVAAAGVPLTFAALVVSQPPNRERPAQQPDFVTRMMAFDKNMDGKLTKDEITDQRLMRLFEQADTNKDGVVTKEELEALAKKLGADDRGGRGGPGGQPGGPGGPGGGPGGRGRGPGGPGGPGGGRAGPMQPGQILPPFLQEMLRLSEEQKKQLDALQSEVNAKLDKILTDEQKKQLKEMRERGPGGPPGGFPGGPGGGPVRPGGPGGPDR